MADTSSTTPARDPDPDPGATIPPLRTRRGESYTQPIFLPVYQPRERVFQLAAWSPERQVEGIIVNAYFLYKQRELREQLETSRSLKDLVGFHGLVTTDSGAFQALTRPLYLSNKKIVGFQDEIGSDVIAPLDLITPPGDNRRRAQDKLLATEKRIAEGLRIAQSSTLAGVQQGGRFFDLRHESVCRLLEMGVEYLAIGSLVPFFNKNHDLSFPAAVVADARREAGGQIPIHVYGAGDPCELPFLVACGATVFDSASYVRYAQTGRFMTPYGALATPGPIVAGEYACGCPVCSESPVSAIFADTNLLARHNLWTISDTVLSTRTLVQSPERLARYLEQVLEVHGAWFPESRLGPSWRLAQEAHAMVGWEGRW